MSVKEQTYFAQMQADMGQRHAYERFFGPGDEREADAQGHFGIIRDNFIRFQAESAGLGYDPMQRLQASMTMSNIGGRAGGRLGDILLNAQGQGLQGADRLLGIAAMAGPAGMRFAKSTFGFAGDRFAGMQLGGAATDRMLSQGLAYDASSQIALATASGAFTGGGTDMIKARQFNMQSDLAEGFSKGQVDGYNKSMNALASVRAMSGMPGSDPTDGDFLSSLGEQRIMAIANGDALTGPERAHHITAAGARIYLEEIKKQQMSRYFGGNSLALELKAEVMGGADQHTALKNVLAKHKGEKGITGQIRDAYSVFNQLPGAEQGAQGGERLYGYAVGGGAAKGLRQQLPGNRRGTFSKLTDTAKAKIARTAEEFLNQNSTHGGGTNKELFTSTLENAPAAQAQQADQVSNPNADAVSAAMSGLGDLNTAAKNLAGTFNDLRKSAGNIHVVN